MRLRPIALAAIAVVLAVGGPVEGQDPDEEAPTRASAVSGFAFEPELVVEVGTLIRWRNDDPAPHTVTARAGAFDSGPIEPGATFAFQAAAAGTYDYFCAIHPSMTGTLTVLATAGNLEPSRAPEGALQGGDAAVLHRTTILDTHPLGIAGPAVNLLVPQGWHVEGGPVWRHQYANLATLEARVTSPDRLRGVEYFPLFPQIWQAGGIPFFPEGSLYLGNEVRPPIRDAGVFLESLVLPAFRADFQPRIVAREPLPEAAAIFAAESLPGTEVVAERVLTEHVVAGVPMLEEFTVVLTFTPNPFVPGAVLWAPQQLFSVRAPADEFEAARPLLIAIATSPVVDLAWYAGYQYVIGLSQRNGLEAIRAAGAASRIIADADAQISDLIIQGYEERQATDDRVFEAVSQTIRGVDTYTDPFGGGTLELPNGYEYVYASAEGNVILTNEPAFDPIQAFPEQTWEAASVER